MFWQIDWEQKRDTLKYIRVFPAGRSIYERAGTSDNRRLLRSKVVAVHEPGHREVDSEWKELM